MSHEKDNVDSSDRACVIIYYNAKTGKSSVCTSPMSETTANRLVIAYNKSVPHLKHEVRKL